MDIDDRNERLEAIAARFFTTKPRTILESAQEPFDISKPNSHETKADFLAEKSFVENALKDAKSLLDCLVASYSPDDPNYETAKAVREAINTSAKQNAKPGKIEIIADLIRKNAAETDLSYPLTLMLLDLVKELMNRKQELESQEAIFWSSKGRSPNHYARAIALRSAKLIARKTGKKPAFGTSSDGSHPSTEFGRALEEVFEVLDIKVNVRHPAKWAIEQITDDDLQPEFVNHLATPMVGSSRSAPHPGNVLAMVTTSLLKDG